MITILDEAQAYAEHLLGRLMTADEAERFRNHIRAAYIERGFPCA